MCANGHTRYIMAIAFAYLLALALTLTGCASSPSQQGGAKYLGESLLAHRPPCGPDGVQQS